MSDTQYRSLPDNSSRPWCGLLRLGPYAADSDSSGRCAVANDDERIALFLDYENLAIGARDGLGGSPFEFDPVADALAERGRVVVRRAYADSSCFDADRQLRARARVDLSEIREL